MADPRSFSQLTTSFFASESLGIPHTPLFTSFKNDLLFHLLHTLLLTVWIRWDFSYVLALHSIINHFMIKHYSLIVQPQKKSRLYTFGYKCIPASIPCTNANRFASVRLLFLHHVNELLCQCFPPKGNVRWLTCFARLAALTMWLFSPWSIVHGP